MGTAALGVQLQLGRATKLTAVSIEKSMASFKLFWAICYGTTGTVLLLASKDLALTRGRREACEWFDSGLFGPSLPISL